MATLYHQIWIEKTPAKLSFATECGIARWWDAPEAMGTDEFSMRELSPGADRGVLRMKLLGQRRGKRMAGECISTHPTSSPTSAWTATHIRFNISEQQDDVALSGFGHAVRIAALDFRHAGWEGSSEYLRLCNPACGKARVQFEQCCESP